MKRFLYFLALGLTVPFFIAASFSNRGVSSAIATDKTTTILVGATQLNYSKAFPISNVLASEGIAVMYKAAGSAVNMRVDFEQSFQEPTTEGTTDTAWLVTDNITTSVTDTDWHMATLDTADMTYGRFRILGASGNGPTNSIQIKYVR